MRHKTRGDKQYRIYHGMGTKNKRAISKNKKRNIIPLDSSQLMVYYTISQDH